MKVSGFDWDNGNWPKCGQHGVSKDEIEGLFHTDPLVREDPFKSEKRARAIGTTSNGRHIMVVFVIRHRDDKALIRPISARYMHKNEVHKYESI